MQENTDQKKTPYLDTFHAVKCLMIIQQSHFTPFPSASIAGFEQVKISWVITCF